MTQLHSSAVEDTDFRQLFSNATSMLVRRFGVRYWEAIEDAVQQALLDASMSWSRERPDSPQAWVYRVAHRKLVDEIRRDAIAARAYSVVAKVDHQVTEELPLEVIRDNKLRMLFVCCSPLLTVDAALPLALKSVGGFGIRELSSAFLVQPEAMKKRLQRARKTLAEANFSAELTPEAMTGERLEAVRQVVYLMFNEGYFSSLDDQPIRDELCEEAIRLVSLLVHDPRTATRNTHALCSLLMFHAARHEQRRDEKGMPQRLVDQDRSKWEPELIKIACQHYDQALNGFEDGPRSVLQIEAAIARQHCLAESFEGTRWDKICELYTRLLDLRPWPEVQVAYAVAVSFATSPENGLALLSEMQPEHSAELDCNYFAAVADCQLRSGDSKAARVSYEQASNIARTQWQRRWLEELMARC